ncbi:hypothetical protein ACFWY6_17450 [Streptomyces sp. NPDC059037]|uniref:hypothetical protein n=1 Tax=Streptomyces sp. NPDC059037 TaxID=3346710 RepID=UPI00368D3163
MAHDDDDIARFVAAHPTHPGFTAARMIDVWEQRISLTDVQAITTDRDERAERSVLEDAAAARRQLVAATRWVQAHHGQEVADAFITYLGNASSGRGENATPPVL